MLLLPSLLPWGGDNYRASLARADKPLGVPGSATIKEFAPFSCANCFLLALQFSLHVQSRVTPHSLMQSSETNPGSFLRRRMLQAAWDTALLPRKTTEQKQGQEQFSKWDDDTHSLLRKPAEKAWPPCSLLLWGLLISCPVLCVTPFRGGRVTGFVAGICRADLKDKFMVTEGERGEG